MKASRHTWFLYQQKKGCWAGRGGGALKRCQEASAAFHCSRLHLSSLRNTSGILLSLKPLGILTAAPPAIQLGEWLHLHCAGERYAGTESGAPFLTRMRRSQVGRGPGEAAGSSVPAISLVPSGHSCSAPRTPLLLTARGSGVCRRNVFLRD